MIKLLDILKEDVNSAEFNRLHWRDHFKEIIKCAETALSSTDAEVINTEVDSIINHAQAAADKQEATYAKANTPVAISSNIANSYTGTDDDITSPGMGDS
jgi:superoxide dismutase